MDACIEIVYSLVNSSVWAIFLAIIIANIVASHVMVEILFYTQLIECELTYAQIYLVILMKDWFVLREREKERC